MKIKKITLLIIIFIIWFINISHWYDTNDLLKYYKEDLNKTITVFFKLWCNNINYDYDYYVNGYRNEKQYIYLDETFKWSASYFYYFWDYLFKDRKNWSDYTRCLMYKELIRKNIQDIINFNLINKIK